MTGRPLADADVSTRAGAAMAADSAAEHLAPILDRIKPFSMVQERSLIGLARQVSAILALGVPGDFVECGVWRGGASFLMAELLREAGASDRRVWLFDSFEGLPPPADIDGATAQAYPEQRNDPWYHDNCRASLEDVQASVAALGLGGWTRLVKGWFEKSLPAHKDRIGPIALLRIDGDWYASVRCCLENLWDQVVKRGLVVLDDYYELGRVRDRHPRVPGESPPGASDRGRRGESGRGRCLRVRRLPKRWQPHDLAVDVSTAPCG